MKHALALILALGALACSEPVGLTEEEVIETAPLPIEEPTDPFAASVARAHNRQGWLSHEVLRADIRLGTAEEARLSGVMWVETGSQRSRFELEGGPTLVWDGRSAWVSPADAEFERARFHVRTWPYFLSAPFKLGDPGAQLQPMPEADAMGQTSAVAKMTFGESVGDSPKDWYIVYQDKETGRLAGMAYTVTYGVSDDAAMQEALDDPHAVTYDHYVEVDGVWIADQWSFRSWAPGEGFGDEARMQMTLSNIQFVTAPEGAFEKPVDARESTLP